MVNDPISMYSVKLLYSTVKCIAAITYVKGKVNAKEFYLLLYSIALRTLFVYSSNYTLLNVFSELNECFMCYVAGTGSLTVLRRTNSKVISTSSSRTSSVASLESDSYASVDLGTDKLPPVDVPEASHICSLRLEMDFILSTSSLDTVKQFVVLKMFKQFVLS